MSRYSRHNPEEPIRHDWTAGGRNPEAQGSLPAPSGSARLDFIQTLNALEAYPGGKNFVAACRVLAGEIAKGQDWAISDHAMRIARATFVTTEDRKNANQET